MLPGKGTLLPERWSTPLIIAGGLTAQRDEMIWLRAPWNSDGMVEMVDGLEGRLGWLTRRAFEGLA